MRLNILKILLIILFLFPFLMFSQKQISEKYKIVKDTSEISQLLKKAGYFIYSNPDSCEYFLNIAEHIAEKIESKFHLMEVNNYRGSLFVQKG